MIKLSKRLLSIANYIDDNSCVLDIGCDHGYLSIYLKQLNNNIKVIASDINKNAISNAINNIKKYNLENSIEVRLGNGLDIINDNEVDTIVISGMGGITIIDIIKNNLNKLNNIKKIIIQSNKDNYYVRKMMMKFNFYIDKEELLIDKNKYYEIIIFKKGKIKYNKKQLYFGPVLLKENSLLFQEKNKKDLKKIKEIYKNIKYKNIKDKLKTYFLIKLYKN